MVFKLNLGYIICFLLTKITILNDNRNSMFIFCVIYNNPFPLHLIIIYSSGACLRNGNRPRVILSSYD